MSNGNYNNITHIHLSYYIKLFTYKILNIDEIRNTVAKLFQIPILV